MFLSLTYRTKTLLVLDDIFTSKIIYAYAILTLWPRYAVQMQNFAWEAIQFLLTIIRKDKKTIILLVLQ